MNKKILIALALACIFISAQAAVYVTVTCNDANCLTCPNTAAGSCTACKPGYLSVGGACTICKDNSVTAGQCATCTSTTTAATCLTPAVGYIVNGLVAGTGGTPAICKDNSVTAGQCATCTSSTTAATCLTPAVGYIVNGLVAGTGGTPAACKDNTVTPNSCNVCTSSSTAASCTTNANGFFGATPAPCSDTNCMTCTAATTCTACNAGSTPDTAGTCCGVANCATCGVVAGGTSVNSQCTVPSSTYGLISSGTATASCSGILAGGLCARCDAAGTAGTVGVCTACITGYASSGTGATFACTATTPVPSTNSPSTAAFNVTPTAVFLSTETSTPAFTGISGPVIYGPGFDSSTEYVWAFAVPTTTGVISVNRRTLNGTYGGSLAKLNSSDTAITTAIPYSASTMAAVGPGYLVIASAVSGTFWNSVGGTATAADLSVTYIPVNGTATTKSITSNTNTNIYYTITSVWYDTGVAYVTYVMSTRTPGTAPAGGTATADTWAYNGIYINGISVSTGVTVYNGTTGGIKAIPLTQSATGTVTGLLCGNGCANLPSGVVSGFTIGGVNITNSSTVNYLWTDNSGTYKVIKTGTITIATGAGTSGTALATEAASTGGVSGVGTTAAPYIVTTYSAGGFLGSFATSGVFVNKRVQTYTAASTFTEVSTVMAYINGSSTAAGNVTVVSGYRANTIYGYGTSDGYVLVERQVNTAATGMNYLYQAERFFTNGSVNGAAVNLGTYNDAPNTHQDGNGSIYLGYTITNTLYPYGTYSGMLGKYLAQSLASGASTLTSIFAFLSLMIVALFAF